MTDGLEVFSNVVGWLIQAARAHPVITTSASNNPAAITEVHRRRISLPLFALLNLIAVLLVAKLRISYYPLHSETAPPIVEV